MKIKNIVGINGISKLLLCGLASLSMSSCEDFCDNMLTQSNPTTLNSSIFWSTLDECNEGLTAVYKSFSGDNIYAFAADANRSDLTFAGVYPTQYVTTNEYYNHTFNNSSTDVGNKWAALYEGIYRANQVIEGLDGMHSTLVTTAEFEQWNRIMGQARFFRGLFHHYLNESYNNGNIPIMRSVPETEADFYQPCSSSELVKEFYRADMVYAESVLPSNGDSDAWSRSDGDMGRITADAASAVLGMSYLSDKDYDNAKLYFEKIINNSAYSLATSVQDNFGLLNEFNSESILEINYTADYNTEYDLWAPQNLTTTANFSVAPSAFEGWLSIYPSYWLYRDFTYEPVDRRNPDNKVYLECDSDGDIFYLNSKNEVESVTDGVTYHEYVVLPKESVAEGNMTYYLKKVAVDEFGEPLANATATYSDLKSGLMALRAYKNMQSYETFDVTVDGETTYQQSGECWKVFYDSDGKPYRYKVHSDRASNSIVMPTEYDVNYYQFKQPLEGFPLSNCYSVYRKFTNWETLNSESEASPQARSALNHRLIRLANIYLLYAEALIEGGTNEGGVAEAMKYINRVRKRAGTVLIGSEAGAEFSGTCTYQDSSDPETTDGETYTNLYNRSDEDYVISTAKQVMDHLMYKERPLELCLEGHSTRVCDLRRWGVTKARFQSLASAPFTTWGYVYYQPKAQALGTNCWGWAMDFDSANSTNSGAKYQYVDASNNYDDSKAYFPIPSDESVSNPNIGTVIYE